MSSRARWAALSLAIVAATALSLAAIEASKKRARDVLHDSAPDAAASVPYREGAAFVPPRPRTCDEAVENIHAALVRPDVELTGSDITDLLAVARDAVEVETDAGSACEPFVLRELESAASCERAYGAVAAAVFSSEKATTSRIDAVVARARPPCQTILFGALQNGVHVDADLALLVERAARSAQGERRTTAWLALGSLELIASSRGESAVAHRLDDVLHAALKSAPAADRVMMLEAAGNGRCTSCIPEILAALRDPKWDVRRSAAAASRFHESPRAVKGMCDRLLEDDEMAVREQAAWSLRWRGNDDEERVECLVTGAATDRALSVRTTATMSLVVLASRSASARSALRHLTGPEYPPEIRAMANSYFLSAGASTVGIE